MNGTEIVLAIISVAGTLSSITFAYLAFKRNNKSDDRKEAKSEGVLISDVGYIKSSIDRIEKTLDKLQEKYDDLHTRVTLIEQKVDDHISNNDIHSKGVK